MIMAGSSMFARLPRYRLAVTGTTRHV